MRDKFLIRMIDIENDRIIRCFQSFNITELLNLYLVAKENEVEVDIPISDNKDTYNGKFAFVKDVRITFGDNETYTCLNVYVDVMY